MPFASAGGDRLHYEWIGPAPDRAPTLVFLHYALGCVETWKDLPARLAEATGCGALVYSRAGSGQSDPVDPAPRPADYLDHEAWSALPDLLTATAVRDPILLGHSDGASIALLDGARPKAAPARAIISIAAHVFYDEHSLTGMRGTRVAWADQGLREGLARYHGDNTDGLYLSWSGRWLEPEALTWSIEQHLPAITCPTLVMQGSEDEHGVIGQVDSIVTKVSGPVERCVLDGIGHEPHREAPERVFEILADFIRRVSVTPAERAG